MPDVGCKFMVGIFDISEFILNNTAPEDTIHLKLDCETSEYGILNSLIRTPEAFDRVKKLMVEFHSIENIVTEENEKERVDLSLKCQELGHIILPWGH